MRSNSTVWVSRPGVLDTIVTFAVESVDGVAAVGAAGLAGLVQKGSRKGSSRAVDVCVSEEGAISVTVHVQVLYGHRSRTWPALSRRSSPMRSPVRSASTSRRSTSTSTASCSRSRRACTNAAGPAARRSRCSTKATSPARASLGDSRVETYSVEDGEPDEFCRDAGHWAWRPI